MTAYNFSNLIIAISCELEMQCIMALEAFNASKNNLNDYKEACSSLPTDLSDFSKIGSFRKKVSEEQYKFFRNIHSLIVCHANISKLLHWKGDGFRGKNKFPGGSSENSIIPGFQYDELNNYYVCSQNKVLTPCKSQSDTTIYLSSSADCKKCSFSESCLAKLKNKGPARYVTRNGVTVF